MNAMTRMRLNIAAHVACIGLSVAALFAGINALNAKAPVQVSAPTGLVDLTGAAESAVNSVVSVLRMPSRSSRLCRVRHGTISLAISLVMAVAAASSDSKCAKVQDRASSYRRTAIS